jgi:hypothetical protein
MAKTRGGKRQCKVEKHHTKMGIKHQGSIKAPHPHTHHKINSVVVSFVVETTTVQQQQQQWKTTTTHHHDGHHGGITCSRMHHIITLQW